jgi:hypothetical protein
LPDSLCRTRADELSGEIAGHLFNLLLDAHFSPFLTIHITLFKINYIPRNINYIPRN